MHTECDTTYHHCCAVQQHCPYRRCLLDCLVHKVVRWCLKRGCPTDLYGQPCVPMCALAYIRTARALVYGAEDLVAQAYDCEPRDAKQQSEYQRQLRMRYEKLNKDGKKPTAADVIEYDIDEGDFAKLTFTITI